MVDMNGADCREDAASIAVEARTAVASIAIASAAMVSSVAGAAGIAVANITEDPTNTAAGVADGSSDSPANNSTPECSVKSVPGGPQGSLEVDPTVLDMIDNGASIKS